MNLFVENDNVEMPDWYVELMERLRFVQLKLLIKFFLKLIF